MDPGQYQCRICFKRYRRREHLQRHNSSHTADRPHRCGSCDSTFQRTDVLKRHLRTCAGRVSDANQPAARRKSCARCIRLKKACNSAQPCQRCFSQGVHCSYPDGSVSKKRTNGSQSRAHSDAIDMSSDMGSFEVDVLSTTTLQMPLPDPDLQLGAFMPNPSDTPFFPEGLDYSSLSWQDFLTMTTESETLRTPPMEVAYAPSLRFLDRFTSNTGFVDSFDCGTKYQREQMLSWSQQDPLTWLDDSLSLKTHQILLLVKEVVMIKPRNSAVTLDWSPVLEQMCLQFFSPSNLRKYLQSYWAIWHPHVNIVHRPSFDPVRAKPAVLATMALIGACVCPYPSDNENARVWFNCVEELVFIDEDFNSDLSFFSSAKISAHRNKIQALQAAYMVCLYQTWEGNDASKRRVRRNRFATLVSTARDIGIPMARHMNYSQQTRSEFDWLEFAVREEFIRVLTWTFLLDTAFIIFNNLPPRMVIKEMKIHTAVPEACFQSMDGDECYEQIQLYLPSESPYWKVSLCSAFQLLCRESLEVTVRDGLAALGPLNLFALTSAIHSLIFQYRNSWGSLQLSSPIHHAVSNWKALWQQFTAALVPGMSPHVTVDHNHIQPEQMWKRVGFFSYCPEYWLLANLMADKLTARNAAEGAAGQGLERLEDGPLDSFLNQYDQTSMRQVNDLILSLSDFRLAG
ncbi:hypothetical protein BDV10DRAFT_183961 [Aspergillus recurvatus]